MTFIFIEFTSTLGSVVFTGRLSGGTTVRLQHRVEIQTFMSHDFKLRIVLTLEIDVQEQGCSN